MKTIKNQAQVAQQHHKVYTLALTKQGQSAKVRHDTSSCLCDTDVQDLSHCAYFNNMQSSILCIHYHASFQLGSFLVMASRDAFCMHESIDSSRMRWSYAVVEVQQTPTLSLM